jgi:hypothetical protein
LTAWFIWTQGAKEPWPSLVHRELLKDEEPGAKNSSTLVAYRIDDDPPPPLESLVKLYPAPKPPEEPNSARGLKL